MFNDARLVNFLANTLAMLALLAMLAGVIIWITQRPVFAISRIEIAPMHAENFNFVSVQGVQATVAGARVSGNFFAINLNQVRSVIETAPWVRRAQVRRVWPDTLAVQIEEQQPLALWNEDQMINTWGEAFSANLGELPDEARLPQLSGPTNSEPLVVQRYAELARWFAPLNLSVSSVALSPRYAWTVTLSNGVILNLGRDPAADAVDLHGRSGALPFAARIERFVQAWPVMVQRLAPRQIASADLRYPNGFAITLAPVSSNTPE